MRSWTVMLSFGREVTEALTADGLKPVRMGPASLWENGVAEGWIESCRREFLTT
jgi:hypothetical protein